MIKNLGLQLYTIRDYLKSPEFADVAFKKMNELGYTEAQTAGNAFDAKLFGELAAKNGISIIGTHYSYEEIINNPEKTMEIHDMWGTKNVGIGGIFGERFKNKESTMAFIDEFNKASETYAKHGFKLTYHNHDHEFFRIDGTKTIMDLMAENFNPETITFVLDTCWVAAGGGDVTAWMEKLAGRIDILHLKDTYLAYENGVKRHNMTEVGRGSIEWDKVIKTAEQIGVKHYVVEQDMFFINDNAFKSIEYSADYLKKYMA